MNDARREIIAKARDLICQARDEEQEYYDNMPEGIQSGKKGDNAQEIIDALDNIESEIDSVLNP